MYFCTFNRYTTFVMANFGLGFEDDTERTTEAGRVKIWCGETHTLYVNVIRKSTFTTW